MGLLLLMVFAVWLGWFPVGLGTPAGVLAEQVTWSDRLEHMLLPALTLSIVGIAPIALHTRQKLSDVLSSDYILFARARGERGFRLFRRHGLRNIALPALSLHFAAFSELFGGAVLAEQVFSYPGLGQATVEAGLRGDVPLLLGIVLFSSLFVFAGNLIADLLYRLIDPRIRERRPA
jgi:peptide/nickel transport system permease protein